MPNAILPNRALQANDHAFSAVWGWTRAIKKAGGVYKGSGYGPSSKEITGVATADLWGGNADPELDTYPTALDGVSAWWCAALPSTFKVPCNTNSTGTFLRGETITQAVSGATGEILGFMYDPVTPANSFLAIMTRTGTFNGVNLITGGTSGATITPSAAVVEYVAEVVIWKSTNQTDGTVYYTRCTTAEGPFSSLFASAGCTATVAPGGGGVGNGFPTTAQAPRGTAGAATHANWFMTTTVGNGKYQAVAANMAPSAGVTPDGTCWLVLGRPGLGAGQAGGFGLFRMDDTEDGDLDPFLWYYTGSATSRTANTGSTDVGQWTSPSAFYSSTFAVWTGWRRRGFTTGDAWQRYWPASLAFRVNGSAYVMLDTFATPETVACTTASQKVREPVWFAAQGATKHRKGTVRWMFYVPTGTSYDDWDTFNMIQVFTADSTNHGIIIGPFDGVTSPLQS